MKNYKILLIEDDKKKIEDISEFINSTYPNAVLTVKESYQSGLRDLFLNQYDLLLLDMSIPTWDKSSTEPGGNYEKFGGYKIMREALRKSKAIKTILITMFDDFGESDTSVTLSQLDNVLKSEFTEYYLGAAYYNSRENKWKDDLKALIDNFKI